MERKFLVLIRRFSLRKEQYLYFSTFCCSFIRLRGETRRFQFGCAVAHQMQYNKYKTAQTEFLLLGGYGVEAHEQT